LVAQKKQKIFSVHRLLAEAFLPNPRSLKTVNHKNGVKADNRLQNLEWASYQENLKHSYVTGLNRPKTCENSHSAKLARTDVLKIRELLAEKKFSQNQIAAQFQVSRGCILGIKTGKTWKLD
jgi:hypothetical protein